MRRPSTFRTAILACTVGGAVAFGACGGGDVPVAVVPGGGTAGPATVTIERSRYEPDEITVTSGTSVEFVNLDEFDHTVTSSDDSEVSFDSGSFGEGETFSRVFDEPGTYGYFCEIHPTMRADVIVE